MSSRPLCCPHPAGICVSFYAVTGPATLLFVLLPARSVYVARAWTIVPFPRFPEDAVQAPVVALTAAVNVSATLPAVHGKVLDLHTTTVTVSESPGPWSAVPETVTEWPPPAVNVVMATAGAVRSMVIDCAPVVPVFPTPSDWVTVTLYVPLADSAGLVV